MTENRYYKAVRSLRAKITSELDKLLWRVSSQVSPHDQCRIIETTESFIRVRDTGGEKQALIFLCDPPITVEAYDELIACFQDDYRVVVLELPCFGFSRISSASALTFEGAVREIEEAIKLLNIEACVLFGPCICGFVAAKLVMRDQLPVKGLVLMQTPDKEGMLSWVKGVDPKGFLRTPLLGQLIVRSSARKIAKFWINYATPKDFDATQLTDSSDRVLAHGGGYPLASMLQLWSEDTQNSNLILPALVIWGKQDRSHKCTASTSTFEHVRNSELVEFPDCGHFSELENPEQFSEAVIPYIERCFTI